MEDNNLKEIEGLIEEFFEHQPRDKEFNFEKIKKEICHIRRYKMSEIREALDNLEIEGKIYVSNKNLYRSFPHSLGYYQGVIKINKFGEGIVTDTNNRYTIKPDNLHGALSGDLVIIKLLEEKEKKNVRSEVKKVLKRKDGHVIVEIQKKADSYTLKPFNAVLDAPIVFNSSNKKVFVEGDRFVVKIDKKTNDIYYADVIKYIGHKDDIDSELKIIALQNNIEIDFSEEAMKETEKIPNKVHASELENRLDLRNKLIFTIDSAKTKDRDDAISLEINEKGNYILGVHIADVTHYVKPGMELWNEAISRSTSVYMSNSVIPMLPHKLSNGICSLNPNEDRLTLSCIMEITPSGKVIDFNFIDCVINSRQALTYDGVNEILEKNNCPEGYEEFIESLQLMSKLSDTLEKNKKKRGYVDFGTRDVEIIVDENNKPVDFIPREQRSAEKIIENFMLLAGECALSYLVLPSPYRVHEQPDEDRVEECFNLLDKSGIKVHKTQEIVNGKVIQQILESIKNADEREIAANIMLRSMKVARYSVENKGHFGLGLNTYGHFTSPIRRAPDLIVHQNIRMQRDNKFDFLIVDSYYDEVDSFCKHASTKERNADRAEREACEYEMNRYIEDHLGEKFNAFVTYVNSRGIFIKTSSGITGKLLVEDIEGDTFIYDDRSCSFKGKKSKIKIKIGTTLTLVALDTKKEYHTINFGLEKENLAQLKLMKK